MNVEKLPNGLTVAIVEDDSIPLVTLDMWVRVGSGDEPSDIAGISHFLEHMLFKGTERLPVGEYDRRVEATGGYLNAATSMDYTHYFITAPSDKFDQLIEDFADVMMNSALDATEVENERLVILEEIRRKNDSPFGYLFDHALPACFRSGPYTHPVIGSSESVGRMTRDQLYEHYERFYTADNMYLSVVGNVNKEDVMARVSQLFEGMRDKRRPYRDSAPATEYAVPQRTTLPRDWNEAYFIMAYPGPASDSLEDFAVSDCASTLLAGGRSSRLVKSIQEKKHLVSNIGVFFPTSMHETPLLIYGTCSIDQLEEAEKAIIAELVSLAEDGITDQEMNRVRRMVVNDHLYSLETNQGRASTIGYSQVNLGSASLLNEYDDHLRKIRKKDIEEFVDRHLLGDDRYFFVTARMNGPNGQ